MVLCISVDVSQDYNQVENVIKQVRGRVSPDPGPTAWGLPRAGKSSLWFSGSVDFMDLVFLHDDDSSAL